jgi:hypothetical protein
VKYEAQANNHNVELSLERGKIRATVEQKYDGDKNKFNVKTPTAVAGVRGTDFLTSFNTESQKSNVITFSGVVAVGQPGLSGEILNPVFVKPGMQTNVGSGKPAEPPRPVPKDEIKTINTDTAAREPSSLPTMIDGKDLDPGLVSRDLNNQPIGGGGGGFVPPTQKNPVGPPPNQFVDGAIQNQRTKVNIIVNKQ